MVSAANTWGKRNPTMVMILGAVFNPLGPQSCDYFYDGCLIYLRDNKNSSILYCGKRLQGLKMYQQFEGKKQVFDFSGHPIIPGLYDMHFHWVQDDVRLKGKDSLLNWLKKYTWPHEAKFANRNYSRQKARHFFHRLRQCGTVGGAIYSSLHDHALEDAMAMAQGQFVVGNVLMAMNSPHYLIQTDSSALAMVRRFVRKFERRFAVTPRFAPTAPVQLMKQVGGLAKKYNCFVQTHLAETQEECAYVVNMFRQFKGFEDIQSYTEIYQRCGLLGARSFFGHGIYLSDDELKMLALAGSAIIHCPTSNAPLKERGLGSGLFDFKRALKWKVPWALGSDIGGGPYLSMIDVMRSFVLQNRRAKHGQANLVHALYRATLAGAELLQLSSERGNFALGKQADVLVLKTKLKGRPTRVEQALAQWVMKNKKQRWRDDRAVALTFLNGQHD